MRRTVERESPKKSSVTDAYTTTPEAEDYIPSLSDVLAVIRRRLWIIVVATLFCVGAAIGIALYQTPQYESSILILVGQEGTPEQSESLTSDVAGLQQLSQTVAKAIETRSVAQGVSEELGLTIEPEVFLSNLTAEQVPNTQFVEVTYRDPSPEEARRVVSATGEVLAQQVSEVSPSASSVTATVWDQANLPDEPASPNILVNTLLGLVIGIFSGLALAFVLEYRDDSWQSAEEAERLTGVPTFGVVPELGFQKRKKKG